MKKRIRLLSGLMLLAGIFSTGASAQEAINAFIKKCETMETVDISIIRTRDENTKEVIRSVTTVHIDSNPALVKEFQDILQKMYDNDFSKVADRDIITRRGGKIVNLLHRYGKVTYNFSVGNDGQSANISVIERNDDDDRNDDVSFQIFDRLLFFDDHFENLKILGHFRPTNMHRNIFLINK